MSRPFSNVRLVDRRRSHLAGLVTLVLLVTAATSPVIGSDAHADEPPTAVEDGEADPDDCSDCEESELAVRTVEHPGLQLDDERFASAMATRVRTDDLAFRGRDLGDALSRVTGLYVRRHGAAGQPARLTIRGGNPRQTAVELDGLRLSTPGPTGLDAGRTFGGIESADVFRGATATTHGAGALTGALRLNPAQATDDGWQATGRTGVGSFGTYGVDTTAGIGDDNAGLRLHGGFEQSRGDFEFVDDQGTAHRRLNNDHRRIDTGATGHIETDDHHLRATGMYQSGGAGSPGPSTFQQSFRDARVDDRHGLATVRWEGQSILEGDALVVDAHGSLGGQQRDYHYRNPRGLMTREEFESHITARSAAATGGLSALIGDSHLARIDVEGRLESFRGTTRNIETEQIRASRQTAAISVADEWLVADDAVSLIGAVRAEASEGRGDAEGSTFRPLLPAVGAIGRLHRRIEVRANAARTFRLPDFDELYLDLEGIRGRPDLDPEEAWTTDAAVRFGADDDPVALQIAGFYRDIDSTILFLPVSSRLIEAQNLRGATSRGLETAGRLDIADRWRLDVGYTYTRATLDNGEGEPTVQLPGQPRHRVGVEADIDLTSLAIWSALPEVRLMPSAHYRSRVNLDHFGHLANDPSLRLDLGAAIGLTSNIRAGVEARNLLDNRQTQESLHRPLPGRSFHASVEFSTSSGTAQ